MKILLVNTHERKGGAGVACQRLFRALLLIGKDVKLLVQYKKSADPNTVVISRGRIGKAYTFFRFVFERATFVFKEKSKDVMFSFSPANAGYNIASEKIVREADIIHLHWINQGYLSLDSLEKIKKLNKPVVWTLHDMWAFTGGCHYSGTCAGYKVHCGNCPFLNHPNSGDLSNQIWNKKKKIFKDFSQLTIVTCSTWLGNLAKESSLFQNKKIMSIPNCIDTGLFRPIDKSKCREKLLLPSNKKLVLFGAMNTSDRRKGFQYLKEALLLLQKNEIAFQNMQLVVFGKTDEKELSELPFLCHYLGVISGEQAIAEVYSCADVFVIPSLEDNLPNTIMESLACGTPVVGFQTGGIPEMIRHKETGYLATYRSAEDLARGILWTLEAGNAMTLSDNARKMAVESYSMETIARQYGEVYENMIASK